MVSGTARFWFYRSIRVLNTVRGISSRVLRASIRTTSCGSRKRRITTQSRYRSASRPSTWGLFAGRVPLILKLNGKTEIPSDDAPISPLNATVEDAVRLGADAVGYTVYVGSGRQAEDLAQFSGVRREAERYGMPVIIWAYPRGSDIETKGGRDSYYAIDYAARVACELGADIVKLNYPKTDPKALAMAPKPYSMMEITPEEAIKQIVKSAGRTLVLLSGGGKMSDADVLAKARACMEAGGVGLIFGRNIWQRPLDQAKRITAELQSILREFGSEG